MDRNGCMPSYLLYSVRLNQPICAITIAQNEAADLLTSIAMNPGLGGFVNNMDFLVLQGV
jgi:hypothetical protein